MSEPDINVSELIDNARLNPFHIRVILLCACLLFFEGFDFYAISYVAPALGQALAISKPMLGPVFSAGQFGLMLGALILGIAGDRWGRKRVFILCGLVFGLASLATTLITSYSWLLICRSIAGLGMGGAGPLAITIASDYCPKRVRAALTMVMYTSFSFGGVFAGAVNAYFLQYGWRTVFYVGGAIPLLLSPVLILALPESLNYLLSRKTRGAEVTAILKKIAPAVPLSVDSCFVMDQAYEKKVQVPELFRTGYGRRTILLWTILFVSLITLFSMTNWLPTLFSTLGIAPKQVVTIMAISQGAGLLGSLVAARLVVSYPPFYVAALGYTIAAALLLSLGKFGLGYAAVLTLNPLLYFFLIGDQNIVNAMAGQLYPPKIRATGTGWGIGIGRIGGILGPSIAGLLLAFHWTPGRLFMLAALPTLATAAAALALSRVMKALQGD